MVSNNIPCPHPSRTAHAEIRLARKLDFGAEVYVVRILRNGHLANARPCINCQNTLRLRGITKCYYSINTTEYGCLVL